MLRARAAADLGLARGTGLGLEAASLGFGGRV